MLLVRDQSHTPMSTQKSVSEFRPTRAASHATLMHCHTLSPLIGPTTLSAWDEFNDSHVILAFAQTATMAWLLSPAIKPV